MTVQPHWHVYLTAPSYGNKGGGVAEVALHTRHTSKYAARQYRGRHYASLKTTNLLGSMIRKCSSPETCLVGLRGADREEDRPLPPRAYGGSRWNDSTTSPC